MIQQQTRLKISDNSGAKIIKCIQCSSGKKSAGVGDFIVISVKELRAKSRATSKVVKGEVYRALITSVKSAHLRKDGSVLRFGQNTAISTDRQGEPIATRIFGPLPRTLRNNKFMKLASISTGFF